MFSLKVCTESRFEFLNFGCLNLVKVSLYTCKEDAGLFFNGHWHILLLLQKFSQLLTTVEQLLGNCIEI
jgi:hypothetical protein